MVWNESVVLALLSFTSPFGGGLRGGKREREREREEVKKERGKM